MLNEQLGAGDILQETVTDWRQIAARNHYYNRETGKHSLVSVGGPQGPHIKCQRAQVGHQGRR